jgi:cation transport ATPase
MAQTKRKRKTKHRGNAAGSIEARGRTSRKAQLSPAEQKKADKAKARDRRMSKAPTWRSAATKAAMMAVLLFVLTQVGFLGKNANLSSSFVLAVFAFVAYTPLAYATDRFVYQRAMKRRAANR